MIFNLLIVDDEAPIRKGLSEYIKWEDYDCKVVATANNGEDAITKINENDINIVLTDVKMPLLDGIGLAKYIHENRPDIAVIILSGYSEFEYARSAIQYHVSQYLLKPASKDQVIAAVKEVCEKIVTSKSNTRIKESELAFLKDQLFQQLTDSNVIDEEKQKKIDSFNLDFSHFYVAAFQLPKDFNEFSKLKDIIKDQQIESHCFRYNNMVLTAYFCDQNSYIGPIVEDCKEIEYLFQEQYGKQLDIGISAHHSTAKHFSKAASEAITALSLNFYSASHIIAFSRDYVANRNIFPVDISVRLHEYETAILQLNFKAAKDVISTLFSNLQSNFTDEASVKNICTQIYLISYRLVMSTYNLPMDEKYVKMLTESSDIFQLKSIVSDMINDLQIQLTQSVKKYSAFIEESLNYIKEHLEDDLSLEQIAQHIHINESYFSRTFKKECGNSVISYINNLRINKAKELLATSNLKTFEISEAVGIHDPAYFSVLFKKNTGMSPKAYRDQFVNV